MQPSWKKRILADIKRWALAPWRLAVGLWRHLDPDTRDLHFYGGLALVVWGLWKMWAPAAPIVGGFCLMYLALRTPPELKAALKEMEERNG